MAIARKVTPEAALFVHFITRVIAEDWTVDGVRVAAGGRAFLAEVAAAFEELERLNARGLRRRRKGHVEAAIAALEAEPTATLAGEMKLLREATERLDAANAIAEQILANNREAAL